ncbi:hypothetical protein ACWGQ5_53970 [Streptomyces sp. NPDC055722]
MHGARPPTRKVCAAPSRTGPRTDRRSPGVVRDSKEAYDSWRASEPEAQRRAPMAPYVVEEREDFYHGRELAVPQQ